MQLEKGGDFMHKRHKYKTLGNKQNVTGTVINYYRNKKEISAQQLSDKLMMKGLDIHRQAIFAIESGLRTVADYELFLIAEALEVTIDELFTKFRELLKDEID